MEGKCHPTRIILVTAASVLLLAVGCSGTSATPEPTEGAVVTPSPPPEPTSSPSPSPTPSPSPSPSPSPVSVSLRGTVTFDGEREGVISFTMGDRCAGTGDFDAIRESADLAFYASDGRLVGVTQLTDSTLTRDALGCVYQWAVTVSDSPPYRIVVADMAEWSVSAVRAGQSLDLAVRASVLGDLPPDPTLEPVFADIELSGRGSRVVRFDIPEYEDAIAAVTYGGQRNFIMWAVDEDGDRFELLVNTIGSYSGTVLATGRDHPIAFEVTATGNWTITIKHYSKARQWDGTRPIEGRGDDVLLIVPPGDDLFTISLNHRGQGNFIIWAYGAGRFPDLVVNEIGRFNGEKLMPDGHIWAITASGNWVIAPDE